MKKVLNKIEKIAMPVLEKIHLKIFGHPMSNTMRRFLGNLSWSFIGVSVVSGSLFVVNILAGRLLGPTGYGQYNLALVIANLIALPILLGLNVTSTKFISGSVREIDKREYMSNSIYIVIISSIIISGIILWGMYFGLFERSDIDSNMICIALLFAIFLSFKNLANSFLEAFKIFKFQARVKIAEGLTAVICFFAFFFILKVDSYEYYILAVMVSSIVFFLIAYLKLQRKIVSWNIKKIKKIIPYTKNTVVIAVVSVLMVTVDKIFLDKSLGLREVGVYSAYLVTSTVFVGQIIIVLNGVFFPEISSLEKKNRDDIVRKIDKLAIKIFLPGTVVLFGISFFVLVLFGEEFQINIYYVGIFSVLSFVQIITSLYRSIVFSDKKSYDKFRRIFSLIPFVIGGMYALLFYLHLNVFIGFVLVYAVYVILYAVVVRSSYHYFLSSSLATYK